MRGRYPSLLAICALCVLASARPARAQEKGGGDGSVSYDSGGGGGGGGDDPAGEFIFGDTRAAQGYAVYRTSFWELGYTFQVMPWLSADGRGPVVLSGIEYDENKGPLINLVMQILALMGVSDYQYLGSSGGYDYYRYDPQTAAAERRAITQTFSRLPLSMGARAYSQALGSQADGFTIEASFRDPVGGSLPAVVWGLGVHMGYFASNPNWHLAAFQSLWGGANVDLRVTLFEYMGLWLRVGAWWGGAQGFSLPIELGPEILIGNRFVLRGLGTIDPMRPEALPQGLGLRVELGVRL